MGAQWVRVKVISVAANKEREGCVKAALGETVSEHIWWSPASLGQKCDVNYYNSYFNRHVLFIKNAK